MFKIDCDNKMTITKGDKAFLNFRCANYKLKEGDNVILIVRKEERTIFEKSTGEFTEKGYATIEIDSEDSNVNIDVYDYVIRVITKEGIDETVINSTLNVI